MISGRSILAFYPQEVFLVMQLDVQAMELGEWTAGLFGQYFLATGLQERRRPVSRPAGDGERLRPVFLARAP